METVPGREDPAVSPIVSPFLASPPVGRRRRPSGEAPPLPRHIDATVRGYSVLVILMIVLWIGLSLPPVLSAVTKADNAVLRLIAKLRTEPLTWVMHRLHALGSAWIVRIAAWSTIIALAALRRVRHLVVYLAVLLLGSLVGSTVALTLGRMRPAGVQILGSWEGYSHPSRPVAMLALVLVGAVYTLVPAGMWRRRAKYAAWTVLVLLSVERLYLAVDHPTDVAAALILGWVLAVIVFRLLTPVDVFPLTHRGGRRAHLDVGGRRGEAIVRALDQQLGVTVIAIEPFSLAGSAGSTPLRLRVRRGSSGRETVLFAKLYALSHLRSDRWYKLARTILYGRLEDEKPFSSVRRLVEYEDHMLRLLRDAGVGTPQPYGFVEMTPEREYLIVMEFFEDAVETGSAELNDAQIDNGLRLVRTLWDAGVAHRDIKPSNVLLRGDHVLLIDVAFAAVRPTPWRQAVDLANMMLTLALSSTPERVYERALKQFAPADVAEAFAASRSVTIPTQLRSRLRADGRDLLECFRQLAPERSPVAIQLWDLRRVGLTLAVIAAGAAAAGTLVAYLRLANLL
jgi:tRNA A-37 threonylcarbamoyl transferase component Bud32/membrane-associated phospholipid phosphatase